MSEQPLVNQTALITGASRGIGRAIVEKLAKEGCRQFIINYFNSSDVAEAFCAELAQQDINAYPVQANVADERSVKEMILLAKEHFGQLDIVVSNAASGVLKPEMEMSTKHWRWCMETNALALHHLAKLASPIMPAGSRILALSSLGSIRAIPNYAFIGASKAALESLVRSLSLELAPNGIAVNAISAGVIDTDALKYFPNREALLAEAEKRSLAGRLMTVADVADAVYLLCRPEAQMIRGQTIFADAGYSIIG